MMTKITNFLVFFCFAVPIFAQDCPTIKDNIGGVSSVILNCANLNSRDCYELTALNIDVKDSDRYKVTSATYPAGGIIPSGTPVGKYVDDEYVMQIKLDDANIFGSQPFSFHFNGKKQSSLMISSNGFVTFSQIEKEGVYSNGQIGTNTLQYGSVQSLSIFGAFQDLDFQNKNGAEIYYRVEGNSPCRSLIVTYYKAKVKGSTVTAKSQIVLHESSGKINVYVEKKPAGVKAIIGVSNEAGKGLPAPGRDSSPDWSADDEGWEFSPDGAVVQPIISWKENGVVMPNVSTTTIPVCPKGVSQNYTATLEYTLASSSTFSSSFNYTATYDVRYPLVQDSFPFYCLNEAVNNTQQFYYKSMLKNPAANPADFRFKFYTNRQDASQGNTNFLNSGNSLLTNMTYFVRVESLLDPTCFRISRLEIGDVSAAQKSKIASVCDTNNDGVEKNFNLSRLVCQIIDEKFVFSSIRFYKVGSNSPVTVTDLSDGMQFDIEVITSSCPAPLKLERITIKFTTAPKIINHTNFPSGSFKIVKCDVVTNTSPPNEEPWDWNKYFKDNLIDIVDPAETNIGIIRYFRTYNDAYNASSELTNKLEESLPNADPALDKITTLYARVEYIQGNSLMEKCRGACFSIAEIKVSVIFNKIILNVQDADNPNEVDDPEVFDSEDADIYLCKNDSRTVNLQVDADKIIKVTKPGTVPHGLEVTFHTSYVSANNLGNIQSGLSSPIQTIPAEVYKQTYYVRYRDGSTENDSCYVVKPLAYHFIDFENPSRPLKKEFAICKDDLSTPVSITLHDYDNAILENYISEIPRPTIKYYDIAGNEIQIANLESTLLKVAAVVTSGLNPLCSEPFTLEIIPRGKPQLLTNLVEEFIDCDNNNDKVEYYNIAALKTKIIASGSGALVRFFRNKSGSNYTNEILESNLVNYKLTQNLTLYLKIENSTNQNCFSEAEIKINLRFNKEPIILKDFVVLTKCNYSGALQVNFDLEVAIPKLYPDTAAYQNKIKSVAFFASEGDANLNNNPIAEAYTMSSLLQDVIVWARFTSIEDCYSIKPVRLRSVKDIQFLPQPEIAICDDNLDGIYTFNLREWIDQRLLLQDPLLLTNQFDSHGASYTFYKTNPTLPGAIPLNLAEQQNFQPHPVSQRSIWILAQIDPNPSTPSGCKAFTEVVFNFGNSNTKIINHDDVPCAGSPIDLTRYEATLGLGTSFLYYSTKADMVAGNNPIATPSSFVYPSAMDVFVRKNTAAGACPEGAIIKLKNPRDSPSLAHNAINNGEPYYYCAGGVVAIPAPDFAVLLPLVTITNFEWKDPQGAVIGTNNAITVGQAGKYSLTLTAENGCIATSTFDVVERELPIITQMVGNGNRFTITATGSKTILYAVSYSNANGSTFMSPWQLSNIFNDLPAGVLTFYVKFDGEDDMEECYTSRENIIPLLRNVITPNVDGKNDAWEIDGLSVFGGNAASLQVFDRFGKMVYESQNAQKLVWDGTSSNRIVYTGTYYYLVKLPDGRTYTGWILVKNNN